MKVKTKVKKLWKVLSRRGRKKKSSSSSSSSSRCSIAMITPGDTLKVYNYDEIKLITNDFSPLNLVATTCRAKFYKGSLPGDDSTRIRTVKIWVFDPADWDLRNSCITSLMEEIKFLNSGEGSHKCLAKMVGCCWDYNSLAAVYDINPLGTLLNLVDEPDCLNWSDRVHIAFKCALLLKHMHGLEPSILAHDLCAEHVLLDQDKNPFYVLLSGVHHDTGAAADHHTDSLAVSGVWSKSYDVFSFGGLLCVLLDVKLCKPTAKGFCSFDETTWKAYKGGRVGGVWDYVSQINSRFMGHHHHNPYDTKKMSKLAIMCLSHWERPAIETVFETIQSLFLFSINERGRLLFKNFLGELTFQDLSTLTDNFSTANTIGETQYGTLFKGKISDGWKGFEEQEVTVKIWDKPKIWCVSEKDLVHKLKDEISFLSHSRSISHPCLPRLIGFCYENKKLGVVYKLKTIGTLNDFLLKDTFNWSDRVEIINQLVSLLHFLQNYDPPYIVGNISASHFLISEGMHLHLVDFGMMTGGILGNKRVEKHLRNRGSKGYIDEMAVTLVGLWKPVIDIFAFGVLLIELMSKKDIVDLENGCGKIFRSFQNESRKYENEKNLAKFVVDEGLKNHTAYKDADAHKILKTAMQCVSPYIPGRMSVFDIIDVIEHLEYFSPVLV